MPQQPISETDPVAPSRMMPRISIGFMLLLTALGGLLAATARNAGAGSALAIAVLSALGFLAACFALFVAVFLGCWLFALLFGAPVKEANTGSPFSDGQLPPQIVPPREPEL